MATFLLGAATDKLTKEDRAAHQVGEIAAPLKREIVSQKLENTKLRRKPKITKKTRSLGPSVPLNGPNDSNDSNDSNVLPAERQADRRSPVVEVTEADVELVVLVGVR